MTPEQKRELLLHGLLTRRERRVCALYYFDGLTIAGVVAALEDEGVVVSRSTVERDLQRMRGYVGLDPMTRK